MQAEKEKLQQQLTQTAQMLETVNQKLAAIKEDTFETADGVVTWVNQRANIVWIDLGFSDGLQKMMTFSVIDRDETGVTKGKVKGRIEVTQLKDAHLAEARIVDVDLSDPILPGDQVYSPSFRKGQKTRFALAGLLDMDRDGKSDQEKVKALIRTNGGEVDAELKEDGKIEGKMTIDTKYLVKGDRPTDKTNQELIKGYTQIIQKATELGIESISLETLLDRMGYFPENRVIPMSGEGSATPAGAGAPGAPSGAGGAAQPFRPRTAPSGATN
jgi:hypothetical protein